MKTSNRQCRLGRPVPSLAVAAAAVAVAVLSSASTARAQYRVGADGHYNDANNRAGSGGYNSPSDASYRAALNTQISTGNVSGLNYFHGSVGTFDPNTLQVNTNDAAVQAFSQYSAPVNYSQRTTGTPNYTSYYNQAQYSAPTPPNFTSTKNNVGFIPTAAADPNIPNSDTRLQLVTNDPSGLATNNLPGPGELDSAGPVDPVGNQSLYSMSALYGVRSVNPNDPTQDNNFVSRYGSNGSAARGPRMDQDSIQKLRTELQTTAVGTQPGQDKGPEIPGGATDGSTPASSGLGQPTRSDAVSGTTVTSPSLTSAASFNAQAVNGAVGQPLSTQRESLLLAPGQQSKQIAELQRRFTAATPHPTAEQSSNQLNRMRLALAKQANDAKAKADGASGAAGGATANPTAGGKPGASGKYGVAAAPGVAARSTPAPMPAGKGSELPSVVTEPPAGQPGVSDQPFVITSLSTGIRAKGLSDLLKSAEGQMRSGQFGQAVDTYDTAAEVAPNNPFVPLGRGFAELGASYYGKAEADLTRAIMAEPAVLAGQYDLKGFLGQDRLAFVEKDLAGIGASDQTARPFLLLAYIDHNTGKDDATVTTKDLNEAARRGANPKLVDLFREAWNLKPAGK